MKRLLALAAVLAAGSPVLAVQTVGVGGTHATIPDALAVAAPGEEIHVRNDHQEFLTVIVTQEQSIISYDGTFTSKLAGAEMLGGLDINLSGSPTVVIDGCTMTGPGGRVNVGLFAGPGDVEFVNSTVTGLDHGVTVFDDADGMHLGFTNSQIVNQEFWGIDLRTRCTVTLTGTQMNGIGWDGLFLGTGAADDPAGMGNTVITLDNSSITDAGFGLILEAPADLTLQNNSAIAQSRFQGMDVRAGASGSNVVFDSSEVVGAGEFGVILSGVTNFTMRNNSQVYNNGLVGIDIRDGSATSVLDFDDSAIYSNGTLGFFFGVPVSGTFDNTSISTNTFEGILFVPGSSGTDLDFTDCTIEANGQHGQFGDGVRVDGDVTLDFLRTDIVNGASTEGDGIFCLGGAALADITLTGCNVDNNGRNGFNTDAFLSTLSITDSSFDGNRDGSGVSTNINANGLDFGAVTNSTFNNNAIEGVQLLRSANGVFEDCEFSGNGFAGIARFIPSLTDQGADPNITSNLTLRRCKMLGNGERAVTLSDSNINATIGDCILENGSLGALHSNNPNANSIEFTADRCFFTDTQGGPAFLVDVTDGGGLMTALTNCLFDGTGTMLTFVNSQAIIDHCTVASAAGGAVLGVAVDATSDIILTRSIVDGSATGVSVAAGATFLEEENIINGSLSGFALDATSLNGVDPMFVTASTGVGTGDFHLMAGSPAVGLASLGVNEDITMGPRPLPAAAPVADSGAYEVDEGSSVSDWNAHSW